MASKLTKREKADEASRTLAALRTARNSSNAFLYDEVAALAERLALATLCDWLQAIDAAQLALGLCGAPTPKFDIPLPASLASGERTDVQPIRPAVEALADLSAPVLEPLPRDDSGVWYQGNKAILVG